MSFLFAHRRGYGVIPAAGRGTFPPSADGESPAEVQRNTLRPSGRTRLRQFAHPGQPVQEKGEDAKSNGETAANFVYCYKIAQNRSVLLEMTGAKC